MDTLSNGATAVPPGATSGGVPPPHASRLDELIAGLRDELEATRVEARDAQRVLDERTRAVTRLTKALAALDETAAPKRLVGRPAKQAKQQPGGYAPVSPESVERIVAVLREIETPQTVDLLDKYVKEHGGGMGRDTIRRALLSARDAERVRVAGRTDRGGVLYALMPEEVERRVDELASA
jgi:hypothetical protein